MGCGLDDMYRLYPGLPVDIGNIPKVVPCIYSSLEYNPFVVQATTGFVSLLVELPCVIKASGFTRRAQPCVLRGLQCVGEGYCEG